jgi:ribosomal protein S12 methylthiotransferase
MPKPKPQPTRRQSAYYLLTLGCPKNLVDSEGMAMLLQRDGYRATADPDRADVLIVNTCGFLDAAKEESIATLQELAAGKQRHQRLVAAGCLAQRNGDEIVRRVPGVDALLGTRRWMEIVPLAAQLRAGRRGERYTLLGDPESGDDGMVLRPSVPHWQRLPQDQRRLQRALCFLLHPHLQGQAAQPAGRGHSRRSGPAGARGAHASW